MSSLLPPLMVGSAILCLVIKYYNSHIQPWFFSKVYNPLLANYHVTCREIKRQHFESMKDHKSADPELRKKGALRILEIGPGPGYNFAFYPAKSQLSVVEVNRFFEEQFFEKQADHPHIKMERFVVGFAEDMKGVESDSFDVVVSSCVLCSVRSVEAALKEIHRVLAPGGKYYYWEHIREYKHSWILFIQQLAAYTYFYNLVFGCSLNRRSDEIIKANKAGYSSVEQQQRFRTPFSSGFFLVTSAHVKGIATK